MLAYLKSLSNKKIDKLLRGGTNVNVAQMAKKQNADVPAGVSKVF